MTKKKKVTKKRKVGRPPNIKKYKRIINHAYAYQTNPSYRNLKSVFRCSQATIDRAWKWKIKTGYKPTRKGYYYK